MRQLPLWLNSNAMWFYLLFVLFSILILKEQIPRLNDFPNGQHTWAQADHLALCEGYVNNQLNFFKPQTYTYTKQYPDAWQTVHETTITPANLPLHAYFPAVIKSIFNIRGPWPMRLFLLLSGLIGLFFLGKLARELQGANSAISLGAVALIFLVVLTSPLYLDYLSKYLPTTFCLSISFIAWYYYFRYSNDRNEKYLRLALVLFFIAASNRLSFALPLSVVLLQSFISLLKGTKFQPKTWYSLFAGMLVLFSWTAYSSYLSNTHGSIFLSSLLPPENWEQFTDHLEIIQKLWLWDFITPSLLLLTTLFALVAVFTRRRVHTNLTLFDRSIAWYFLAAFSFFLVMFRQFHAHDYYLLDTFYAPLLLLILVACSKLTNHQRSSLRFVPLLGVLCILFLSLPQSVKSIKKRALRPVWDQNEIINANYPLWKKQLDEMKVAEDAKLLILNSSAPNLPFIHLQHKGMLVKYHEKELLNKAMAWPYDCHFIDFRNFAKEIYPLYPELIQQTKLVQHAAGFGLGVYAKDSTRTIEDWFKSSPSKIFNQQQLRQEFTLSPESSSFPSIEPLEFPWSLKTKKTAVAKASFLILSGHYSGGSSKAPILVFHDDKNGNRFDFALGDFMNSEGNFELLFYVDYESSKASGFTLYPWNIHAEKAKFKELHLKQIDL